PIPTPPIIIEAPTIITIVLESDALSVVQLRVVNLEKDVSELKKIDHPTEALATLKSQVPMVVEHYLGSKIAGPSQGKKTKRRRTKESESSNKPSTTNETSKVKASSKSSKTGKFETTKESIKEPSAEVEMDDVVNTAAED
nr:hypothetical protein [Tanacetum cinerariifolium]GFB19295.1 hypothetical protein [Tanacetum cinerariifolium]